MPYYTVALSMVTGICLGFGILYLFIGLRRKDHKSLNLTFALFALSYAGTLFNGIRFHGATSVAEYVSVSRWDAVFVVLAFSTLIWYVGFYTGVRPRVFLWGLTVAYVMAGIANIVRPNMVYEEILGLAYVTLPWGEQLAYLEATDSLWSLLFLVAQLATLGFIVAACVLQFRRGQRRAATILGIGMLWFIATLAAELMGEGGLIGYMPYGEFGFLGLAVAVSLQMANSVIRTEEELAQHRHNLETLVEARTAELKEANLQLVGEIDERRRAEEALRASDRMARALMNAPPDSALLIDREGIILDINQVGATRLGVSVAQAQGMRVYDLFEPDLADLRRAKVGEAMATKQPVRWEDVRDGRYIDNNLYPILDADGAVTRIAVFGADITERRHTEAALRQRVEELAVLNRIAHTLATVADLPTALETISETVTYLFDALYIHVILPMDETNELMRLVGFEREAGPVRRTRVDVPLTELPLARQVLSQGRSQAMLDLQAQPLVSPVREYLSERNVQSILLVPLLVRGAAVGLIAVAGDQAGRDFSADEVRLAETIAGDVAAAVENARLVEGATAAAAAEERNRIARELHDSVTQTMYSVSIVAEALPRLLERNLEEAKRNAAYLRQTTLGALAEMRTLLFELRPGALEKTGLDVLLQQLADVLTGRTRVPVEVTIQGEAELPADVKIGLYRIAQETFNNIARHARATNAWATLRSGPDKAILVIRDNGRGFDPKSIPPEHMGVRIMRERAEEIGAVLTVESQLGDGTEITVEWTKDEGRTTNDE
jgi:PAS domain S-box-containing protein